MTNTKLSTDDKLDLDDMINNELFVKYYPLLMDARKIRSLTLKKLIAATIAMKCLPEMNIDFLMKVLECEERAAYDYRRSIRLMGMIMGDFSL